MLRRLSPEQPESFAFTAANKAWAEAQMTKYPEGRQASAIIPLLWRAQEQEGWLTRPAIECVADMLGMAYIRALEVATFYFMFHLEPVGSVAHIQVCGTTSCMICGGEDLIAVCKEKIAAAPHTLSPDGRFSWEEVECLGACANAPVAQIGKDYYEDLTAERLSGIIDEFAAGKVPMPGSQTGRYGSEPAAGLTTLKGYEAGRAQYNATIALAVARGDTIRRIDGDEMPLSTPWLGGAENENIAKAAPAQAGGRKAAKSAPEAAGGASPVVSQGRKPATLRAAREGGADDLKAIKGVGPKLEALLNQLGFYHFDQIAAWSAEEVAWVDRNLEGFKGRVSRDGWVDQAKILAAGGETEFSKKVKAGGIY